MGRSFEILNVCSPHLFVDLSIILSNINFFPSACPFFYGFHKNFILFSLWSAVLIPPHLSAERSGLKPCQA
ncbi:MAG: hypothetical protein EB053_04955 [Chlamydiae bacterium]|nr:hypothetical protein [Chlamydiota bacterium]